MVSYKVPLVVTLIVAYVSTAYSQASDEATKQEYLEVHNKAREEVGLEPLVWCDQLADVALEWANQRKADCEFIHSTGPYGENFGSCTGDMKPGTAVQHWVDEKADYTYDTNECAPGKDCGHYTQVVSKKTTKVGCAKVKCDNGGTFVACYYDPPGNCVGEKPY